MTKKFPFLYSLIFVLSLPCSTALTSFAEEYYEEDLEEKSSQNAIILRGGYGLGLIDPADVNSEHSLKNSRITDSSAGGASTTTFKLDDIENSSAASFYAGYRVTEEVEFGAEFSFPGSNEITTSGVINSSGVTVTEKINVGMNALLARLNWHFYKSGDLDLYLSPGIGVGFFSYELNESGQNTYAIDASSTDVMFKGMIGAEYRFNDQFGIYAEGGYQIAKSSALNVDSVTGAAVHPFAVSPAQVANTNLRFLDGQTAELDMSGLLFTAGLSLTFGL